MSGAINPVPTTPSRLAQGQLYFYFYNDVVCLRRSSEVPGVWIEVDFVSKNKSVVLLPLAHCELECLFAAYVCVHSIGLGEVSLVRLHNMKLLLLSIRFELTQFFRVL
jgi:hypothetical protein